jgi:hypothetical protein
MDTIETLRLGLPTIDTTKIKQLPISPPATPQQGIGSPEEGLLEAEEDDHIGNHVVHDWLMERVSEFRDVVNLRARVCTTPVKPRFLKHISIKPATRKTSAMQ